MIPAWHKHPKPAEQPAGNPLARPDTRPPVVRKLQWLAWLYFALLLTEGALRKWFLPGLATPLLLVRDPVVIAMYGLAIQGGVFPRGGLINTLLVVALLTLALGLVQMASGDTTLPVMLYGLRTDFLHLPLIFLMPKIFNHDDIVRLGRVVLLIAIPMAVLMFLQFSSPRDARINAAIGDGATQIDSAYGKIRPAGTFSFVTGVVAFLAMSAAFFLHALGTRRMYPQVLMLGAGFSLVAGIAVSGSRSALLETVLVGGCYFLGLALTKRLGSGLLKFAVVAGVIAAVVAKTTFLDEGIMIFTARWDLAADVEKAGGGILGRWLADVIGPVKQAVNLPVLGLGLGRGTNVGAQLLGGTPGVFLLAEGEWGRVLCESGPVVGAFYLICRIAIVVELARRGVRAARAGNALPLLLFGACALLIFNGQFGPATTLGFAAWVAGLSLAAGVPGRMTQPAEAASVAAATGSDQSSGRAPWRPSRFRPKAAVPPSA